MSTSLPSHRFGIVGYRDVSQNFEAGMTPFRVEQPREKLRCSHGRSLDVWAQGGVERSFRTLPIGAKPTFVELQVPRVLCFDCGKVRQVKVSFAHPKKHYTHSRERYALLPPRRAREHQGSGTRLRSFPCHQAVQQETERL